MPTNFWLEWAEVGGEIEASLTPPEAKSFTRMLRTRARGRPGSSWSEKASGASFECLLEESAGSPSASRAQRQRPPPKQDKNAAWAEKRAPWDAKAAEDKERATAEMKAYKEAKRAAAAADDSDSDAEPASASKPAADDDSDSD